MCENDSDSAFLQHTKKCQSKSNLTRAKKICCCFTFETINHSYRCLSVFVFLRLIGSKLSKKRFDVNVLELKTNRLLKDTTILSPRDQRSFSSLVKILELGSLLVIVNVILLVLVLVQVLVIVIGLLSIA
jgi:hypothetical protein